MVIDKIANIGKIFTGKKADKVSQPAGAKASADSVSISSEAKQAQELAQATGIVSKSETVRADRVKEVKEKLARGDYDQLEPEMLDKVAEKIARSLLG
jgi:negative regulator of flagellin synthesis FlgM